MTWNKIVSEIEEYEKEEAKDVSLEKKNIDKIKHLLSNYKLKNYIEKVTDPETYMDFNYANLTDLSDMIKQLDEQVQIAKDEIDISEFYKRGEILDFPKLRKWFKDKKLYKKFPKFNWDRYEELVKTPITEIPNYQGEVIKYSRFLVKKIIIGINQMIFSEMDLYILNVGKEGSGKSCFASQLLLYIYTFLKEVGLVDYAYDVKKLFFSSLKSLLEVQDAQKDDDYFRIMVLDEAYELNRMNFREDPSKEFKDDMRSSRKMLRIVILNLPQVGELETAITLTRTNFIFYSDMDSSPKLGTVKKGSANFYIIPRGKKIYSPYQRRNISDKEIVNTLNKVMKDKNDAYKGFPDNVLIDKIKFQGIWGFNKEHYDKHIYEQNKQRRMSTNIKLTDYIGYIMFKKMPELKNWDFDMKDKSEKKMYFTVQKWRRTNITNRYITNPELLTKFEVLYSTDK